MNIWTFPLFIGAADRELLCSSLSQKANSDGNYSRDDPPCMGNVQSIEANPRHSPYAALLDGHLCRPRYLY